MNIQNTLIVASLFSCLVTGPAHAALQGRDLNGSAGSFEAYYDTELDITWLADANYAMTSGHFTSGADGSMNWAEANAWAANLSFTDGVNVYDNWRLPVVAPINGINFNYSGSLNGSTDNGHNISAPGSVFAGSTANEMAHLFFNTLGNKGLCAPASSIGFCDGPQAGWGLTNAGPFANMRSDLYWTATAYEPRAGEAWDFYFGDGSQSSNLRGAAFHAWAVSTGDVAAIPEADTWAMLLVGLGLIGWRTRQRGSLSRMSEKTIPAYKWPVSIL
jgi:hypothetical protein